jgi:hypothetical protein
MYQEILLKAEKVAAQVLIDKEVEANVALIETWTEDLILRLSKFIYTSEEADIKVPLPDGVWQHFKQDYLPARYLNKYPVRYKYITVKAKEVFPHLSYLAHNKARHLHLRLYEPLKFEDVHCGT